MKLKSVEFLMQQLFDPSWKEGIEIQKKWFKTAKDMHKAEIIEAYNRGYEAGRDSESRTPEHYYDKTFNTNDE